MDWNDQKYGEIWRQGWAATANRYLEANDRPERLDLRSYERQGLDKIPTVHMGPAVSQMEKRGIQTNIGNLNRDITAANRLMQSIRQMVRHLKGWIADLKEKKATLLEALQLSLIHIFPCAGCASYPFVDLPPGNTLHCKMFPSDKFYKIQLYISG